MRIHAWIIPLILVATLALASARVHAAETDAPVAVNGLRFTVTAERTELRIAANGTVAPTGFTFTLTNVGKTPIRLDAYDFVWRRLKLDVTGPDAESVRVVRRFVKRLMALPGPEDYPLLQPGKGWTCSHRPRFPGNFGASRYTLLKAGDYRVRFAYRAAGNLPRAGDRAQNTWKGSVTSNTITFKVVRRDGGEPVNGLRFTLAADKTELRMLPDGKVEWTQLTFAFTNVGKKPIKLNAYTLAWRLIAFDVNGPDAESVRIARSHIAKSWPGPAAKDFPLIAPGKTHTQRYRPAFPGTFSGNAYQFLKAGEYHITAIYTCTPAHQRMDHAAGCWTGSVTSNEIVLKVVKDGTAGGEPVNGLKLTLAADTTELKMTPRALRRAIKDTPRWNVTPTKFSFTFTNVGDKPVKLDAYDLVWSRLKIDVTGPDAGSVRVVKRLIDRQMAAPQPKDYPVLKPGEKWTHPYRPRFPGNFGPDEYILLKPGDYRVKVTYSVPRQPLVVEPLSFRAGTWEGSVTSNEIVLKAAAK